MSLGERKRKILKAIIDEYIEHGEPVGSKVIAMHSGLDLSPATIRNEMSDLENMGYLQQPHVSSGRIPSQAGYRLYVDELMNGHKLTNTEIEAINQGLQLKMKELDELIRGVSRVMAQLTNYTTYAVVSGASEVCIRKFDLMLVDSRTVVVVMLSSRHDIRNTYLKTAFPITEEELSVLNRMLNQLFTNLTLDKIDMLLVRRAEREMGRLGVLVPPIVNFAAEVMEEGAENNVYVGGASRILSHPEYRDTAKAQKLLDFISERKGLSVADDEGVHIAIGRENNAEPLSDASVVYGSYGKGTPMQGTLGIVGPVRMDYAKVAANLNYFLTGLDKLLRETFSIEEE
ncbi:MAG: heat-inducible transcription repressor HrcA [Clostridia bacterium]|nr:heat-inducible transcription repressor HrcA [Clostridia bacterium]